VTSLSLGGPGPGCSVTRVRRLLAGEFGPAERARVEEHLRGCARCQEAERLLREEALAVESALPFDRFAAGVAEKLARSEEPPARRARRLLPLALAAALAAAVAVPLVARLASGPDDGLRVKGGPSLALYAEEAGQARLLLPGERVPVGVPLRLALGAVERAEAAVLLVDADGPTLLYAGRARPGPLPGAFEWTGDGPGVLLAVLSDAPIDAADLLARVRRGGAGAAALPEAEVVTLPLERGPRP